MLKTNRLKPPRGWDIKNNFGREQIGTEQEFVEGTTKEGQRIQWAERRIEGERTEKTLIKMMALGQE